MTFVIDPTLFGFPQTDSARTSTLTLAAGTLLNDAAGILSSITTTVSTTTLAMGTTLSLHGNPLEINYLQERASVIVGNTASTVLTLDAGSFGGVISGSGSLSKNGTGTLLLFGANTFSGTTTIPNGILQIGIADALQNSTLAPSYADGGTLVLVAGLGNFNVGGLSGDGNVTLTDAGGAAVALAAGSNNASTTYAGVLSGSGSLDKTGSGTLTLSGTNTYSGGTTISAGTLSVAADGNLGLAAGTVTVLQGGALVFTGAAVTTSRTFNLGTSTLAPASGGTLTYAGATVNGGILGAGNHVLTGSTTLDDTRTVSGTTLTQTSGTSAFENVTLGGTSTFAQSSGAVVNSTGDFITTPSTTVTVGGTFNLAGGDISGR